MIGALISIIMIYGCDSLESDVAPKIPQVALDGTEIYIARNGTGIIDLNNMVKSSGAVRLDVTGKPVSGTLTKLSGAVLQYLPNANFTSGRDAFEFSIYSRENTLLGKDTVIIIVEPDSTQLPCGVYPQTDYVKGVSSSHLIQVLQNDILCGDSADFAVEVYQPDTSYPPTFGTAIVQGQSLRYTPGPGFAGYDSIVYKVYDVRDTTRWGIGRVYMSPASACTFEVYNDSFVFRRDSIGADTTAFLDIYSNDQLCGKPASHYQFTLIDDGDIGSASFDNSGLRYRIPGAPQTFSDSAVYKLCYGARCEIARVYIQVK